MGPTHSRFVLVSDVPVQQSLQQVEIHYRGTIPRIHHMSSKHTA